MIKNMVTVHLHGLMEENMQENGLMVNNMGKEYLQKLVVKVDKENGQMVKEFDGLNLENRYVIENFSQINYKIICINYFLKKMIL